MRVLFATSEAQPLIRDGGLAEVSRGLPRALAELGEDVRLILPGYSKALLSAYDLEPVGSLKPGVHGEEIRILIGRVPGSRLAIYLVNAPTLFEREGGPYTSADGDGWADNAERFALFCRAIVEVAMGRVKNDWTPEVVHCNDWQTGLAPALLSLEGARPGTLFTLHNLSSQGLFSWDTFQRLRIPQTLWSRHGLEHYGNFSFIKGGLAFSDRINTVSPTYAREILRTDSGLEEVLRRHSDRLIGILHGVDYSVWDPRRDPHLPFNYDRDTLSDKGENKIVLRRWLDLPDSTNTPLIIHSGRLLSRRGSDLLLEVLPELTRLGAQIAVLGRGERQFEQAWGAAARRWPGQVAVVIGDDQALLHLMVASADVVALPARVEPCGLSQLYCLRYGTIPVVRATGGLADTVADCGGDDEPLPNATGFAFTEPDGGALLQALERAMQCYRSDRPFWATLMRNAMNQDFSWTRSAGKYRTLYRQTTPGLRTGTG